jgi:DNA-binding GntR family transcriptional regulator
LDAFDARVGSTEGASLGDLAYREIKRLMLTLELRPNDWYRVGQLSERLGIGRTPVRDAVQRLATEGLLRVGNRLGVQVAPISMREFDDQVEARLVIEPAIARLAAMRATEAELGALHDLMRSVAPNIAVLQVERLMEIDGAFHARLAELSRNGYLKGMLSQLVERFLRLWFLALIDREHSMIVWDEHWVICGAILGRDGERAAAAAREHIETFRDRLRRCHAAAMRDPEMREMFDADDR